MSSRPLLPIEQQAASLDATLEAGAQPARDVDAPVPVSQRLGRFVILRQLGTGGMGTVYAAWDEQLDRKVALKLLHTRETEQDTNRQRVLREAQAMARVSHPHVVHVYDVGELGSQIFMAMEYVEGTTLSEWQKQRRTWQELLAIYRQAGKGLLAAHQTGLVHRDFKPENVLVDKEGLARVADFGLARLQGDSVPEARSEHESAAPATLRSPLTATGTLSGTPGYMSPEQFRCEAADSRSDQFSFCVALYEALYGQRPFGGETLHEVSTEVRAGRLRKAPETSQVPIEIEKALARGLAVASGDRFPTMAELLSALEVDHERDPQGARSARLRMSMILAGSTVILSISSMLRGEPVQFSMRILTMLMIFVMSLFMGGIVVFRKTLFRNHFHRGLTLLTLSGVTTVFAMRAMAWHLSMDVLKYYPLDLLVFAGICAGVSLQYLPRLWPFTPLMIGLSLAASQWPRHGHQFANIGYTLVPLGFIYGWYLIASQTPDALLSASAAESPSSRIRRLALLVSGRSGKSR